MKKNSRFLMLVLTIFTVILSACGGTNIPVTGSGGAIQTLPTAFIAVVESITGDQWTISGQTVAIDPGVVRGGPFNIGDLVKVEVVVNQDSSFTVSSVGTPSVEELSTLPRLEGGDVNFNDANANTNDNNDNDSNAGNINSNDNTNDANSNDNTNNANSNDNNNNDANSNDNNSNDANSNDDNSNDDNNGNDNNNDNDNGDNDNSNDNDSSGPGSGNDNDDSGGNNNDNG